MNKPKRPEKFYPNTQEIAIDKDSKIASQWRNQAIDDCRAYYGSDDYKRQCARELIESGVVRVDEEIVYKIISSLTNINQLTCFDIGDLSKEISQSKQVIKVVDDE